MSEFFYLNFRGELQRNDMSYVAFQVDGNYTKILLTNGLEGLVGVNQVKMEQLISLRLQNKSQRFARIEMGYIVDLKYLLKIRTLKHNLILRDQKTYTSSLIYQRQPLRS